MATANTAPSAVRLTQYAALDIKADAEKFWQGQTSAQAGLANGTAAHLLLYPKGACWPMGSY